MHIHIKKMEVVKKNVSTAEIGFSMFTRFSAQFAILRVGIYARNQNECSNKFVSSVKFKVSVGSIER